MNLKKLFVLCLISASAQSYADETQSPSIDTNSQNVKKQDPITSKKTSNSATVESKQNKKEQANQKKSLTKNADQNLKSSEQKSTPIKKDTVPVEAKKNRPELDLNKDQKKLLNTKKVQTKQLEDQIEPVETNKDMKKTDAEKDEKKPVKISKSDETSFAQMNQTQKKSYDFGKTILNLKLSPVRLDKIDFDGGFELGMHEKVSVGISLAGKGLGTFADQESFSLSIREKHHEQNELVKTRFLSASLTSTYYVDQMNTNNFYFRLMFSYGVLEGKLNHTVLDRSLENFSIDRGTSFARIYGFSPSVGYQWLWENGFNINLGFGPSIFKTEALEFMYTDNNQSEEITVKRRYGNDIFPYANVSLGLML
ncbi:MAG: hypothetical protein AB8G05_09210 [Oligoflexales bacterium]